MKYKSAMIVSKWKILYFTFILHQQNYRRRFFVDDSKF